MKINKIVILDAFTSVRDDLNWNAFEAVAKVDAFDRTSPEQVVERCAGAEVVLTNKVVLNSAHFEELPDLKYVGVLATGFNNVDLSAARALLARTNLTGTPFSPALPAARLHWLLADETGCVTVEPSAEGLRVYDNPAGVLTNEPPFPQQLFRLNDYQTLSPRAPENRFAPEPPLRTYSRGMGALGLPGDLSSGSRFVRAAFTRANAVSGASETESVSQFFHILGSVEQSRGCCELSPGEYEITLYTSCCSAKRGIYYYTTYGNRRISAVDMHRCDLNGAALCRFTPRTEEDVFFQNREELQ